MDRDQVLVIVDSLANGVDPATGLKLPHDVFHSADVVRALFAAATLLRGEPAAPAAPPKPRPAAAGARWTEQEDSLVCHAFDAGTPVAKIASQHGRTRGAITSRLVKLGRIDPETVKTRDRGLLH